MDRHGPLQRAPKKPAADLEPHFLSSDFSLKSRPSGDRPKGPTAIKERVRNNMPNFKIGIRCPSTPGDSEMGKLLKTDS